MKTIHQIVAYFNDDKHNKDKQEFSYNNQGCIWHFILGSTLGCVIECQQNSIPTIHTITFDDECNLWNSSGENNIYEKEIDEYMYLLACVKQWMNTYLIKEMYTEFEMHNIGEGVRVAMGYDDDIHYMRKDISMYIDRTDRIDEIRNYNGFRQPLKDIINI